MLTNLRKHVNLGTRNIHYLRKLNNTSAVLSRDCLDFIQELHKKNIDLYNKTLPLRKHQKNNFRDDTENIRNGEWKAAEIPADLLKRNVEITGPGNSAKMVINAFNSKADGYMLDLEDSMTPSWPNVINSHKNITEAVRGELIDYKYDKNTWNTIK